MSQTATNLKAESHLSEIYGQYPFELVRGEGVYVYDTAGKRYLDLYGGHAVALVGHSPPRVAKAIAEQANQLMFYSNLARIPLREQAAAKLVGFARNGLTKAFFCNSGGEANENAIKISIKNTGRQKVASFAGSFHGRTLLAIGATDHPDWHEYLHGWIGPTAQLRPNIEEDLEKIDNETACVILEPIQSIGKCTVFSPEYLKKLRKRCDETGAYLIFDEVQTGMGRTGVPFVSGHCGTNPDMMTLAKGLGGGFAMGAVVMTAEVDSKLKVGDIAATFGGGPMALGAMMATIDQVVEDKLIDNAKRIEAHARKIFPALAQVKEVRGRGCLLGIVIDRPAKPVQTALFAKGIITGPNSDPNLVHLLPPLTLQTEHLDMLYQALTEVLK